MRNLKIGTWNIKNSYFNIKKNETKADAVIQLLDTQDLDILTLQEVNPILARKIEENLKIVSSEYKINSNYRKSINPISNLRIEYDLIISRLQPIASSSKCKLPFIPKKFKLDQLTSIRKRYLTTQSFFEENSFYVNTTHLDFAFDELNQRQMQEVFNQIENQRKYHSLSILTGNLNRQPQDKNMVNFKQQLAEVGMQVVENPHKTYLGHTEEQPVDYVIIPNDWDTLSVETLDAYDDISSHRPVIVETKKR